MIKRTFTIPGEPIAKARARTGKGFSFTPTKTVNYETLVKEIYHLNYPNAPLLEGQITMNVAAYFTIPKSASQKKREGMISGFVRPVKRPDWDNIGKIVSDALNTIAYHDDSAIVEATVQKWYSDIPRIEVELLGEESSLKGEKPAKKPRKRGERGKTI